METPEGHIFLWTHFTPATTLESVGLPLFMLKYQASICQGFAYCPVPNIALSIWHSGHCWKPSVIPDKWAFGWWILPGVLGEGPTFLNGVLEDIHTFPCLHFVFGTSSILVTDTVWPYGRSHRILIALYTDLLWFCSLWYMANKTCTDKNNWISRSVTCFWWNRIILQNVQKIVAAS